MELTSAVRSVSCNNSNTMTTKCMTPNQSGSNGIPHSAGSLNRQASLKHASTKDDGSGHEGDDEDEYGGGHGMTKTTAPISLARYVKTQKVGKGFFILLQRNPRKIWNLQIWEYLLRRKVFY